MYFQNLGMESQFSTIQVEILNKLYKLAISKPTPVSKHSIHEIEGRILAKQVIRQTGELFSEFALHIRYRIDLFNFISLLTVKNKFSLYSSE